MIKNNSRERHHSGPSRKETKKRAAILLYLIVE